MNDPFRTLGLVPSFDLSNSVLEQRQRELSKALHPDRYTGRPPSERRAALNEAMRVNEAFRALRDPITRAEQLLLVRGVAPEAEERAAPVAPLFLMQMMECREELALIRDRMDAAQLDAFRMRLAAEERELLTQLSAAFATVPVEAGQGAAAGLLGKLRFYRRLLDEVRACLDDLA